MPVVSHFAGPDDTDGPLQALPAADRERWLATMRRIEPISFIGRAARPLMTPEAHEPPDGPAAAAQPADLAPGSGFAGNRIREVLGLLDEPLDEHTGLRIPKAAGQGIVRQDVA